MKHLIVSRELPPAPGGGIGTYVMHVSRLLAEHGEEVHVIGAQWEGGEKSIEELVDGRLVVHRVPLRDWKRKGIRRHPAVDASPLLKGLFDSGFHPLAFAWQASLLAEKLVAEEGIDVVEAQEFEAPLYFFQLRRALGAGPRRKPPCIVHLHSPTELIVRYNDWDVYAPFYQQARRMEDYAIHAADALLCPSQFLARQTEEHYGLEANSVESIPLPLGKGDRVERGPDIWKTGTICFAGRMERRKGIIEWIDAAVDVARDHRDVHFELVGAQTPGASREFLRKRIPASLRSRFVFLGNQPRAAMPGILARARIAAVPSRWENFPYVCLESMLSGLPVIASRSGGMVEMITDGRSGWLAPACDARNLAMALRRALETGPEELATMGAAAADEVRRLCDPQKILDAHLELRGRVAGDGSRRSSSLPGEGAPSDEKTTTARRGIAVVVTRKDSWSGLGECLATVARQEARPSAVVLGRDVLSLRDTEVEEALSLLSPHFVPADSGSESFRNVAVDEVLESGLSPAGFAFVDASERLSTGFVEVCEKVLESAPDVGIVSSWCWQPERRGLWSRPNPAFPYQWVSNEASPMSVFRVEALLAAGKFREDVGAGYELWDLVNAVLAAGWKAVTVPSPLGTLGERPRLLELDDERRRARTLLFTRFPELIIRQAPEIVSLAQSVASEVAKREYASWYRQRGLRGLVLRGRRMLSRVKQSVKTRLTKD